MVTEVLAEQSLPRRRSRLKSSSSRSSNVGALAALFASAVVLASSPAQAIERQHHLGLGPALGILAINGKSTTSVGFGGLLHYTYGLTDQFNLTIEGGSAI